MDSFERVKRCFAFEKTDRPPVWDWIRNDTIIEHFTGRALTVENGRASCMETYKKVLDATKQEMRFPEKERNYFDSDGKRFRQQRWTSWMDTDPAMLEQESLVSGIRFKISEYSGWNQSAQKKLDLILEDWREKQKEADQVMVFPCIGHVGLTEAYEYTNGIERFIYLMYDEPDLVADFLSLLYQKTMDRLSHLPESFKPFAVFIGEDLAYKNGLLFPPQFLHNHFLPYLSKIIEAYHAIGAKVLFHSDGNLWEIMDDLVDAGIDGINPIEELSGMTVKDLRKRYPELVLCGGLDVSSLFAHGSPEECYNKTIENIQASPRGYIVGGSAEIHTAVRLENYLAMLKAVKDSSNSGK